MASLVWTKQFQTGLRTSTAPQLATFNQYVWAAFKGEGSDTQGYYSHFAESPDQTWVAAQKIPNVSTVTTISLTVLGNRLYAFWTQPANADHSAYTVHYTFFDGNSWDSAKNTPASIPRLLTGSIVNCATYNNAIHIAFRGAPSYPDDACHWMYFDGTNPWSAPASLAGGGSVLGPSLAVFNNELFAMWQGIPGDDAIYWARYNGSWGSQKKINGVGTSGTPSMAVVNVASNQLVAVWKGSKTDTGIYFTMFDGNDDWSYNGQPQGTLSGSGTSYGPGFAGWYGAIAAWQGDPGDDRIWWAGVQWK
jgi:hypothetical protein